MEVIRVASRGRVTLPARVRKSLGISDQSYLVAERIGTFVVLRRLDERLDELTELFERHARRRSISREALLQAR